MAYPKFSQLNAKQRKLALKRWHDRQQGDAHPAQPQTPAADRNPLYNPGVTLAGQQLKSAIDQIVGGQFRPAENALDRQAQTAQVQNQALAARVAGYGTQVDKRADVAAARQQAIAEQLAQRLDQMGERAQTTADQVQAQEGQARAAAEQLTGGPADPQNRVAEELAAMRARTATNTQAAGTEGAVEGANYAYLTNANRQALQLHGQEQQGQIANRLASELADIRAKRADLGVQKGAERTKQLLGQRQSQFENLVTMKGLGIKQEGILADIQRQRQELGLAQRRQSEIERNNRNVRQDRAADNAREDQKFASAQEQDTYQRQHHLGPYKPASSGSGSAAKESTDARKIKVGVVNAAADFKSLLTKADKNGKYRSRQRVEQILAKRGAPPIVILAAGDLAQFGYVRPGHLQSLREIGVQVPASWRKPKGKGKRKPSGPPHSIGAAIGDALGG